MYMNENNDHILIDSCNFAVNRYKWSEDCLQLKESAGVYDQWSHDWWPDEYWTPGCCCSRSAAAGRHNGQETHTPWGTALGQLQERQKEEKCPGPFVMKAIISVWIKRLLQGSDAINYIYSIVNFLNFFLFFLIKDQTGIKANNFCFN